MLGAIVGDIIGSPYEHPGRQIKTTEFPLFGPDSRFTDDTVLTCAVAEWVLTGAGADLPQLLKKWHGMYPTIGYGPMFDNWVKSPEMGPYRSFGNGSAMRVSPVAWVAKSLPDSMELAHRSAIVTHDHPIGVASAEVVSACIYMAKERMPRSAIWTALGMYYDWPKLADNRTPVDSELRARIRKFPKLADIRPTYKFDATCEGSVPQSILCFLESTDYESAVRNAVSLGGDSDTMACIAGSIAAAFYGGVPRSMQLETNVRLDGSAKAMMEQFVAAHPGAGWVGQSEERYLIKAGFNGVLDPD